jgi:peptide/nickel transport system permease protein
MLLRYLVKRLGMALAVILLILLFLVVVVDLVPGDPARIMLRDRATPQLIAMVQHQMGLDQPLPVQVWSFIWGLLHGNLGTDFFSGDPVTTLILQVVPDTVALALSGVFLAILVGVPLGVLVARRPNSPLDRAVGAVSMLLISTLPYVLALGLLLIFAVHWHAFPAIGTGTFSQPGDYLHHLLLPALALAIPWWGYLARLVRASMLEVLGASYIRTAWAFGLRERLVFYKYTLKNALVPVLGLFGMMLGYTLAGTLYVEVIFNRAGLGGLALQAINDRDWPIVRGTVLLYALFFILGNLISDLSYRFLDPRIRVEEGVEVPA